MYGSIIYNKIILWHVYFLCIFPSKLNGIYDTDGFVTSIKLIQLCCIYVIITVALVAYHLPKSNQLAIQSPSWVGPIYVQQSTQQSLCLRQYNLTTSCSHWVHRDQSNCLQGNPIWYELRSHFLVQQLHQLIEPSWCIYAWVNWITIGTRDGFTTNWFQIITWTNDVIWIFRNKSYWNFKLCFKNFNLKMSTKRQLSCSGLHV